MIYFDNNAIASGSGTSGDSLSTQDSEVAGREDLYPLLLEHAAVIVGKTLRPEPGMFKFRSKLLRCTFDKGDIWAFVARREQRLLICRVSCGPYKEFEILDEVPFPDMDQYVHTQSKPLRLPAEREVHSRLEALNMVARCMKRKTTAPEISASTAACRRLLEGIGEIYRTASAAGASAEDILNGLETMFAAPLSEPLPDNEASVLMRFNDAMRSGMNHRRIIDELRHNILTSQKVLYTTHKVRPEVTVRNLIEAIVSDSDMADMLNL